MPIARQKQKNLLLSALIVVLLFNVVLQIWLLYTSLNHALAQHKGVAVPAAIGSGVIFLVGALWLYFLPKDTRV